MTQFTCKGVKQINNRISFKHLYHSYLSAFFISTGVPNGEFPEILIAKCRSRFYCTWFFVGGISCGRLMSPAHETQSMREIRLLRRRLPRKGGGGVNRYAMVILTHYCIYYQVTMVILTHYYIYYQVTMVILTHYYIYYQVTMVILTHYYIYYQVTMVILT